MPAEAKFIVLGLDGCIPNIVTEYVKKDYLPNFKKVMEKGVYGKNLPFPSAVTPGNWVSIASGSCPGTNGISDFSVHIPGTPLSESQNAFNAEQCLAQLMWDHLSEEGHRVATISFPGSRPRNTNGHTSIGNDGNPTENSLEYMLAPSGLFVAGEIKPAKSYKKTNYKRIKLECPSGWSNIPPKYNLLREANITVSSKNPECSGSYSYYLLLVEVNSEKMLIISHEKNFRSILIEVELLQWSDWLEEEFILKGDPVKAVFRFRLVKMDAKDEELQLYLSPIYPKTAFAEPDYYGEVLYDKAGPYFDSLNISNLLNDWLDYEGLLDEFRYQGVWQAKATLELLNNLNHVGVFTKWHGFDKFYHKFFDKIDSKSPHFNSSEFDHYETIHKKLLKIADEMLGIIIDGMEHNNTSLFVLSDHGLLPSSKFVWVNNYLMKHGYINTYKDNHGNILIDWKRTKAIMYPWVMIWINLKGREPEGCVEPADYNKVCEDIIELLRDWKDPETGKHVIDEVFHIHNGVNYGLWGERDGDIRLFTRPGYTLYRSNTLTEDLRLITASNGPYKGDHGSSRPSTRFGRGSEVGFFSAIGNGIRKGYKRRIPIKPCDIVPTISHTINVKPPKNSEGAILHDILTQGKK